MHHLGLTRSANQRDHLFLTPDTFVRTQLPGFVSAQAIVHVSPQAGAAFTMMTVELEDGGSLSQGPVQRFVYVLEGEMELGADGAGAASNLAEGGFAYFPPGMNHRITANGTARAVVIDKPFEGLDHYAVTMLEESGERTEPWMHSGLEAEVHPTPLNGDEALQVRTLLPNQAPFDFACNTMTYDPGASLSQVEIHYMEHGLLMLEGAGIYRLGDQWYPTQAGDFIWMAPYCPQWFCAVGKTPAKYLIYKNANRHTLTT